MQSDRPWHKQKEFWTTFESIMFREEKLAAAIGEIEPVVALTGIGRGDAVLDLGCGTGRHTLDLVQRRFAVTGVDRTIPYLDEVRAAADERELDIDLVHEDMRNLIYPRAFDWPSTCIRPYDHETRQIVARATK